MSEKGRTEQGCGAYNKYYALQTISAHEKNCAETSTDQSSSTRVDAFICLMSSQSGPDSDSTSSQLQNVDGSQQ